MFLDKFKKEQKVAYQTIYNSFKNGHKSHAYLISGEKDSYVKETALLIAKSFICDEDILCCEKCRNCKRIDDESYCDFKFINKEEETIKVSDIEDLRNEFNMSALEEKGIRVYIIHLIENANNVAVNKLLKFLEEPNDNVFGILTTKNLSQVLPTIVSRCQLIRISSPSKEELFNKLIENNIDSKDANILSLFSSSYEEANEFYNDNYLEIKETANKTLNIILNNINSLAFFMQKNVEEVYKERKEIKLFIDILGYYIKELILKSKDNVFLEKVLAKLLIVEGKINYNVNINLVLDQLVYEIMNIKGE